MGDRESREPGPHEKPIVDVSAALGEAGHEVEDLGYGDVPDSGPLLQQAGAAEARRDVNDALDVIVVQAPSD